MLYSVAVVFRATDLRTTVREVLGPVSMQGAGTLDVHHFATGNVKLNISVCDLAGVPLAGITTVPNFTIPQALPVGQFACPRVCRST